jgi:hypothetical protein
VTERNDAETLATAKNQTEAMIALAAEVKQLRTSGRRTWKFVLFDVALTILLAVVSFIAVHASDSARGAQTAAVAARAAAKVAEQDNKNLCMSSNVNRAQETGLWDFLFDLAGPAKTKEGAKLDAEFLHHVAVLFAPRDCSHVNPGTP